MTRSAVDVSSLSNLERLLLAQAVYVHGNSDWAKVSNELTNNPLLLASRPVPNKAFSPLSCSNLYIRLMEDAELEKPSNGALNASVHLELAKRHWHIRAVELRDLISEQDAKFKKLIAEIEQLSSDKPVPPPAAEVHELEVAEDETKPVVPPQDDSPTPDVPPVVPAAEAINDTDPSEIAVSSIEPEKPLENEISPAEELNPTSEPDMAMDVDEKEKKEEPETKEEPSALTDQKQLEIIEDEDNATGDEKNRLGSKRRRSSVTTLVALPVVAPTPSVPVPQPKKRGRPRRRPETPPPIPDPEPTAIHSEKEQTPLSDAPARRQSKRKASIQDDIDSVDKKRLREDSEPMEDDGHAGPSNAPSRRRLTTKEQKRFQSVMNLLHQDISRHRSGGIFHNPIKKSEAPDYHDIVKRPMDLKTIKNRIKEGIITNTLEFERDICLMFANAMMYNRPNSEIYAMTEEMMQESEVRINAHRETEAMRR
ncbi:hypothetical protein C8J56DRAFT_548883 [Mycena floridula]|nr:hypothetical protein C8J56DRAFT_548883 [Mycena floridula]